MFKKRIHSLNRYREIAQALAKHGFGYILQDVGLFHLLSLTKRFSTNHQKGDVETRGERLRYVMEELGPTFVKLGQLLSIRPDLIPDDVMKELEKLQDDVPSFPFEKAVELIEEELDASIDDHFDHFDNKLLAAASIGQVYQAYLKSGEKVVIKIQRPDIRSKVETDIDILKDIARLAEQHYDWAKQYRVCDVVDELSKTLRDELDYTLEARNTEKIRKQFIDQEDIHVPHVYWEYTTKKILVLEHIAGKKLSKLEPESDGLDKKIIADKLVKAYLNQVLYAGFFHGDPHPGNIFFLPNNHIAFIDFGQVGSLNDEMRYHFSSLVIALMNQSTDGIIQTLLSMSVVPQGVEYDRLYIDVDLLREKYYDVPLQQLNLGESIRDLFNVAHRHGIHIPKDYTLMAKGLITIESIASELDPELSIIKIAEPYGKKLLKDRYNPKTMAENMWSGITRYSNELLLLPQQLKQIMTKAENGSLRLQFSVPELNIILKKLDHIGNRLSFSLTLLAFSIIVVGLIIGSTFGHEDSILRTIPAIEIGFIISFLMFIGLLYSIFRSGRF